MWLKSHVVCFIVRSMLLQFSSDSYIFLYCRAACLFSLHFKIKPKRRKKLRKCCKNSTKPFFFFFCLLSHLIVSCLLDAPSSPNTFLCVSYKVILLHNYDKAIRNRELTFRHYYHLILRLHSSYSLNVLYGKRKDSL